MNTIEIPGTPPSTTAQMTRFRCAKVQGRMMPIAYKSKEQKAAIQHYMDGIPEQSPILGPVAVEISFAWPWRKSEPKSVTEKHLFKWKDVKPDLDNLAKTVIDVMAAKNCFEVGDQQVARLTLEKVWCAEGYTAISWWPLKI